MILDLSDYYPSVEWDILDIPSKRHTLFYMSCCPDMGHFVDITYYITVRRKPLFYTVNLIFPCVGISFLTILVFYLPSDSGEKITLCISILVSLTVFFLLLTEIIPATSIVLPLIGKYLLFTMIMVSLSVIVTVVALNLHFRTPTTHKMPKWVKKVFLKTLPKYLFMKRPIGDDDSFRRVSSRSYTYNPTTKELTASVSRQSSGKNKSGGGSGKNLLQVPDIQMRLKKEMEDIYRRPDVIQAFENICFIADLLKRRDKDDRVGFLLKLF